jgi:predicted glycosyltransferase
MRIWLDLSNSPHALLFEPVVSALEARGHAVLITARDNSQTVELALERWPETEIIGGESPRARGAKGATLARRVAELRRWARSRRPDVALSHNSYAQILAAVACRLPPVTAMDYEHQPANHLAFRLAHTVLLPAAMRQFPVERLGARPAKTRFYPGAKEELYLGDFTPDPEVLSRLGISRSATSVIVVARTPPSRALYHSAGNPLFEQALRTVCAQEHTRTVVLARHAEQRRALQRMALERLIVPDMAIDSRSLLHAADLVIGAGGTMTREAALLGVPTFTAFAGRPAAVDGWLQRSGRLSRLDSPAQLGDLRPRSSPRSDLDRLRERGRLLLEHFIAAATLAPPPQEPVGGTVGPERAAAAA